MVKDVRLTAALVFQLAGEGILDVKDNRVILECPRKRKNPLL
jgi:hypothetical protein